MPFHTTAAGLRWRKYSRQESLTQWLVFLAVLLLTLISFRIISEYTFWDFFWDAPNQLATMMSRMFPPQWSYMQRLWRPLWDTLVIATLGTIGAVLFAVPLAFLAAGNTTPSKRFVRPAATLIMVTSRSINALIWGLLLVTILGPGVLAGILAITFRSIGFIAKLLYEAIEEIDEVQVEAISAVGAGPWHILWFAIVSQITPAFFSITIYRWDINIRESSVLGIVGAGGIGLYLNSSIASLAWDQVSVILMTVLISVVLAEMVTYRVRKILI
ncbi:MAG: phosphonate ABC transporter, permease protein PhnE [Spirochaeta sp.]